MLNIEVKEVAFDIHSIVNVIVERDGILLKELKSRCRERRLVFARQKVFYLARKFTKMSLSEIGGYMGGKDHTSVIHGINTIKDLMFSDENIKKEMIDLCRLFEQTKATILKVAV